MCQLYTNLLNFYEYLEVGLDKISTYKHRFWHYSQCELSDCYSLNSSVIDYKHSKFRVRVYPSLQGGAKTEWIMTFNSEWCEDWSSKAYVSSHVEMFVWLRSVCSEQVTIVVRDHVATLCFNIQAASLWVVKELQLHTVHSICRLHYLNNSTCYFCKSLYFLSRSICSSFYKTAGSLSGSKGTILDSSHSQLKPIQTTNTNCSSENPL
jgi:hypothetical protein